MASWNVRRATIDDGARIAAVAAAAWRDTYAGFYERRGFTPRERLEATLFGEPVVERRWWRPAASRGLDGRPPSIPSR